MNSEDAHKTRRSICRHSLINQICHLFCIDLNSVSAFCLPMRRKHYDGLWLDFCCYLLSDVLNLVVRRMVNVIHDVGLYTIYQRTSTQTNRMFAGSMKSGTGLRRHETGYSQVSLLIENGRGGWHTNRPAFEPWFV